MPKDLDAQTSTMVSRIKRTFEKNDSDPLHWTHVRNHDKRLYICNELQTEQWAYSAVVTDKQHPINKADIGLHQKWKLYFYSTRLLLERLSWYARDTGQNGKAHLIFENRSNMNYGEIRDYLDKLYGWIPPLQISWRNLAWRTFQVKPKTSESSSSS